MDRGRLARWTRDLGDPEFACALAAAGAIGAATRGRRKAVPRADASEGEIAALLREARGADGLLAWSAAGAPRAPAATVVRAWSAVAAEWPNVRLALEGGPVRARLVARRVLVHPRVGAASVFLSGPTGSDGRSEWRWPFTISLLPGDPLLPLLEARENDERRSPWPYRYDAADREHERSEMLVVRGAAREVARALGRSGLRAAFVLCLGPEPADAAAEPAVRAIADVLGADGVAFRPEPTGGPVATKDLLREFAHGLAHDEPVDVALGRFGEGLAFLDPRLVATMSPRRTALRLGARLKKKGRRAIRISPPSADLLVRGTRPPAPPRPAAAPDDEVVLVDPAPGERALPRTGAPPRRPAGWARARPPEAAGEAAGESMPAERLGEALERGASGFGFARESDEASAVSELSETLRDLERADARAAAGPRFLQHLWLHEPVGRDEREAPGLVRGTAVRLRIWIGPRSRRGRAADVAFPEERLPPGKNRLQVVLHEPRHVPKPLVREIELRSAGPSTHADFRLRPTEAGPFRARVIVLHRGRVLQTVRLETRVLERAPRGKRPASTWRVEAEVRPGFADLDGRRRFDAAFVLNRTDDARPTLTAVAGGRAWITDLTGIQDAVREISLELGKAANDARSFGKGLYEGRCPELLVSLALHGFELYELLFKEYLERSREDGYDPSRVTHLQIVGTRPDEVVPLEFLYDYPPPEDDAAEVCPRALEALKKGECPADCAGTKNPGRHVCPVGFWGMRKVIERHVFDPNAKGIDRGVVVRSEPTDARPTLPLDEQVIVSWSQEVPDPTGEAFVRAVQGAVSKPVRVAKDWKDWKEGVRTSRPTLLVAFPHNAGDSVRIALEIRGATMRTLGLGREYVAAEGRTPLVLLLGCDTAGTGEAYSSHVRRFRNAGAACVVSTIATVFGKHAVQAGDAILGGLLRPGRRRASRLGEILRDAKCDGMAKGLPAALSVVAFGDADWKL